MNFKAMFEDQQTFNRQLFTAQSRRSKPMCMERLRVLSLGMLEEMSEFLRTFEWKSHRNYRQGHLTNVAHSHEELVDMFKYWMSMADMADFPIDKLEELYYAKSRVVQYRFQEEWMKSIDRDCVIVDIDNVLADYKTAICEWARQWGPSLLKWSNSETIRLTIHLDMLMKSGAWIDADSVGLSDQQWGVIKHDFRTKGGKRSIPTFPDALQFLSWCVQRGWLIILMTSRPINRYPNLFTDTITWLYDNKLPFDYLWWADDKALRLEEYEHVSLRSRVVFAVDDDARYIAQFRSKGVKAYHLTRSGVDQSNDHVHSLTEIMEKETVHA